MLSSSTQYYYPSRLTSAMKVAVSAADGFVAPYIIEMLGDSAVIIPDEALGEPTSLDALLTPCQALVTSILDL